MNYKFYFYIFFFVFFINSSIAQISNNIKNSGIFNNQDYKYLLNSNIAQSIEYRKLQFSFENEIINLDEFKNSIDKIIKENRRMDKIHAEKIAEEQRKEKKLAAQKKLIEDKIIAEKKRKEEESKQKEILSKKINKKNIITKYKNLPKNKIGKVLQTNRGRSFADDEQLVKNFSINTNTLYKTLAGGRLIIELDAKSKIILGSESELIISKFDILDLKNDVTTKKSTLVSLAKNFEFPINFDGHEKKEHNVQVEFISGSFSYESLRKTNTELEILLDDEIIKSSGNETKIAAVKNVKEIKFVNAGKSDLIFNDKIFLLGESVKLNRKSKSIIYANNTYKHGDDLMGSTLENYSMTKSQNPTVAKMNNRASTAGGVGISSSSSSGGDSGSGCKFSY